VSDGGDLGARGVALLGLGVMIALAWLTSTDRRRVPWRVVAWGLALQLGLGVLLLRSPVGTAFFVGLNQAVAAFLG